ncbi:unnamed protein product [Brassica oleracea]|uniref:(rape) hypothetical protein n=1 Tax=Brassica napus TaxID=3708 RepID=A0A816LF28_BRANA|nr:unnamed protein product [Brassica napus]
MDKNSIFYDTNPLSNKVRLHKIWCSLWFFSLLHGESGGSWRVDPLESSVALVALRKYGVCSLFEDDEEPSEITSSVIGAGSSSPVDRKGMVSEKVEELALSRTCETADLVRHTAVRVWSCSSLKLTSGGRGTPLWVVLLTVTGGGSGAGLGLPGAETLWSSDLKPPGSNRRRMRLAPGLLSHRPTPLCLDLL